jgi:hypothetical protein
LLKGAALRDDATFEPGAASDVADVRVHAASRRSGEAILRRTSAAGEGREKMTTVIESGRNASEVKKNLEAVNRP